MVELSVKLHTLHTLSDYFKCIISTQGVFVTLSFSSNTAAGIIGNSGSLKKNGFTGGCNYSSELLLKNRMGKCKQSETSRHLPGHRRSDYLYDDEVWRKSGILIQDQDCFPLKKHSGRPAIQWPCLSARLQGCSCKGGAQKCTPPPFFNSGVPTICDQDSAIWHKCNNLQKRYLTKGWTRTANMILVNWLINFASVFPCSLGCNKR